MYVSAPLRQQHPQILRLYQSGESVGVLCHVMPFVGGESRDDRVAGDDDAGA